VVLKVDHATYLHPIPSPKSGPGAPG
jgi:hypothetical protein